MSTVSIIIPTYDRVKYLRESIESIIEQSFEDFELIVVDNGPNENTREMVSCFNDARIIYYRNQSGAGISKNYNKALELCSGKYIQIFSDDDLMHKNCLKEKVEVLENYPTVGLVHSDINVINSQGKITSNKHWGTLVWKNWENLHRCDKFFSKEIYHKYLFSVHNIICMPSVMIRKSVADQVGGFDEKLLYLLDWDYWLRVTLNYDVFFIKKKLISFRSHETSTTTRVQSIGPLELKYIKFKIKNTKPDSNIYKSSWVDDFYQENMFYSHYSHIRMFKLLSIKLFKYFLNKFHAFAT